MQLTPQSQLIAGVTEADFEYKRETAFKLQGDLYMMIVMKVIVVMTDVDVRQYLIHDSDGVYKSYCEGDGSGF